MAFLDPPQLPSARAGKFCPGQGEMVKVPGYSCAHCGCLVVRTRKYGVFAVHAWNRSPFCRPWRGDFRRAKAYEGA